MRQRGIRLWLPIPSVLDNLGTIHGLNRMFGGVGKVDQRQELARQHGRLEKPNALEQSVLAAIFCECFMFTCVFDQRLGASGLGEQRRHGGDFRVQRLLNFVGRTRPVQRKEPRELGFDMRAQAAHEIPANVAQFPPCGYVRCEHGQNLDGREDVERRGVVADGNEDGLGQILIQHSQREWRGDALHRYRAERAERRPRQGQPCVQWGRQRAISHQEAFDTRLV
ncbi:hypothetical protein H257_17924 [Aphanomyces astaci]|uniref:Uncharacterized protein n=1 Tax=Aphanomyces astaci TaxID=112090 RepID=W4FF11_APHAT|nr:hypothetical protein H257_17924 [Aphanomyces astaci]ETV65323.1 hypothetical protein H257_17924 [Aphanomyces astaci]|eukprot:XP_009845189.1 hypothetical protein H257_17924 [Aphanomyces astaci]